jgi:hypothetical protein
MSNVTVESRYELIPGFIVLNVTSVFFGIAVAVVCLISFLTTQKQTLLPNAIKEWTGGRIYIFTNEPDCRYIYRTNTAMYIRLTLLSLQ